MTLDQLYSGQSLLVKITAKEQRIADLERASTVTVHYTSGQGVTLLTTIGLHESSEHPEADLGRAFIQAMLVAAKQELGTLYAKLAEL